MLLRLGVTPIGCYSDWVLLRLGAACRIRSDLQTFRFFARGLLRVAIENFWWDVLLTHEFLRVTICANLNAIIMIDLRHDNAQCIRDAQNTCLEKNSYTKRLCTAHEKMEL